ncbi:MAG: prolyl oligopeptidase family serine peptidase [Chloroflexia bacterium]|nr:prolyl oligopeptidase family serine peptidase [Chloroflexia bacterium]
MALAHRPEARFAATSASEFDEWKRETLPKVIATLGVFPERVPLNPKLLAEWETDGLKRQKWLIDVGPYISATLYVNIPAALQEGERRPAILCWHGHGNYGKEIVMGTGATPEARDAIARTNYNFGQQMAQRGYVTFAIDWIGRGERNDNNKPNLRNTDRGRDWCNLYYLSATMLGMTSIGINVAHGMAATDFVSSLPQIDADRLGVMGISGGGTMTLWSALCDERFSAIELICYSDLWAHFGFRDLNYCGMQVAPGLYKLVDLPDLQGLLAPRPLLVNIGAEDDCFSVDTAMECFRRVTTIYETSGHQAALELDLHPGGHAWGNNKSEAFFLTHLGA